MVLDITMSLDGFVAGPHATLDEPLGEGGERLHAWGVASAAWRQQHGREGGEENVDSDVVAEHVGGLGATVMGRRMFSGGAGPWEEDPNAGGWWGEEPPFAHPVFVLTHHDREPLALGATTFTFVTDGIESALDQARDVAGDRSVGIAGGADVAQQYLRARLIEEMQIHVAPVFLGGGVRLFDGIAQDVEVEPIRAIHSPAVTHVRYRVG